MMAHAHCCTACQVLLDALIRHRIGGRRGWPNRCSTGAEAGGLHHFRAEQLCCHAAPKKTVDTRTGVVTGMSAHLSGRDAMLMNTSRGECVDAAPRARGRAAQHGPRTTDVRCPSNLGGEAISAHLGGEEDRAVMNGPGSPSRHRLRQKTLHRSGKEQHVH